MSESYKLTYGEVLRKLRHYHGYTQKEISDQLSITSQAYSNYENNKRTPDIETMQKIALFYGKTLDQLVEYRFTKQIEDSRNYAAARSLYRAVDDTGITIPLTGKQAKILTDILALPAEQQNACQKLTKLLLDSVS